VTVTKGKNQTVSGSVSIKLPGGNGTSGSTDSKKPSGSKPVSAGSDKTGVSFHWIILLLA
jgi:hypothetical protein